MRTTAFRATGSRWSSLIEMFDAAESSMIVRIVLALLQTTHDGIWFIADEVHRRITEMWFWQGHPTLPASRVALSSNLILASTFLIVITKVDDLLHVHTAHHITLC